MENLGYQLAVFIIVWAAFFGYLFTISQRQKRLRRDLDSLKNKRGNTGNKPLP